METYTKICKCCGKEFTTKNPTASFCSGRCANFFRAQEMRNRESREISKQVKEDTRQYLRDKNYLSISDAAKFLGVARNTLYRIIETGGIPLLRFSARTVRISCRDLERYVPVNLVPETDREAAEKRLSDLAAARKTRKSPRKTTGRKSVSVPERESEERRSAAPSVPIIVTSIKDIPVPELTDPNGWYTYAELEKMTGITSGSIKGYCKANDIPRRQIGVRTCISKPHWDRARGQGIDLSPYYSSRELVERYGLEKHHIQTILTKNGVARIKIGTFVYYAKKEADYALTHRPTKPARLTK